MLQHVWERASQARYLTGIVIATDDDRIYSAAQSFGACVVMTRSDHVSGTDRVAEVAAASDAEWVVNVQGDEPTLDPSAIDVAILGVLDQEDALMGTLKTRIFKPEVVQDPNVVKVVTDQQGDAIYFSRAPIPFIRQTLQELARTTEPRAAEQRDSSDSFEGRAGPVRASDTADYFKHIGLYVYRREFLLAYPDLPVGPLERAERLEQLRALENGYKIRVVETDYDALGVDTPEDLKHVTELFERTSPGKAFLNKDMVNK